MTVLLQIANVLFFVFHTALMAFNCVGWIWPRTRVWHLASLLATASSWFIVGYWYTWGYCLCTDWHFQVRRELGYRDTENHYLQLLTKKLLGMEITPAQGDLIVGSVFVAIVIATVTVHVRAWFFGKNLSS